MIYNYKEDTGEFTGVSKEVSNPPTNSTKIPVPQTGTNEVAVFNGSSWEVLDDFRGTVYWVEAGAKRTVTSLGETLPKVYYLKEPDMRTPEEVANQRATEVNKSVSKFVFSKMSRNDQMNMTAMAAAGLLSSEQKQAYVDGLLWLKSARELAVLARTDLSIDVTNEGVWPELPETTQELIANV